jgi:hypothetical protein
LPRSLRVSRARRERLTGQTATRPTVQLPRPLSPTLPPHSAAPAPKLASDTALRWGLGLLAAVICALSLTLGVTTAKHTLALFREPPTQRSIGS